MQVDAIGSKERCETHKCINAKSILSVNVRVTMNTREAKKSVSARARTGDLARVRRT